MHKYEGRMVISTRHQSRVSGSRDRTQMTSTSRIGPLELWACSSRRKLPAAFSSCGHIFVMPHLFGILVDLSLGAR